MVDEVRGLIDHPLIISLDGFDDSLHRFLTHFLGHSWRTCLEKRGCVGLLRHLLMAAFDNSLQFTDETLAFRNGIPPACLGTRVAGRSVRNCTDKKGILVAVDGQRHKVKIIPAGLSLCPDLSLRTAPEGHEARFLSLGESLGIHVAEHQHLKGVLILNDGRNQPVSTLFQFFESDHILLSFNYILTLIPSSRSLRLSSGILISP